MEVPSGEHSTSSSWVNVGLLDLRKGVCDRLRTHLPPELEVEGDEHRSVSTGEPLTLVAFANDPDNFPPRREDGRGDSPSTLEELYRVPGDRPFKVHPACGFRGWFTGVPHGT